MQPRFCSAALCTHALTRCTRKTVKWASVGSVGRRNLVTSPSQARMMIWDLARKEERKLNLPQLIEFGRGADRSTLLMSANILKRELPVSIAKRMQELQALPPQFLATKALTELMNLYEESFIRIVDHPPPKYNDAEESFSKMLTEVKQKHKLAQGNIALGFAEVQRDGAPRSATEKDEIQDILVSFFSGRLGARLLMDQHLSLRRDIEHFDSCEDLPQVGVVNLDTPIKEVLLDAVSDAANASKLHLGDAPEVDIQDDLQITAAYVPHHLYTVLLELFKNSMKATVELHGRRTEDHDPLFGEQLPPLRVTISGGEDCMIRISDQGGGIPPHHLDRVWNFNFSTTPQGMNELSGFGFGMSISRVYARYWGGDLDIQNIENYGVDTFFRLGVPASNLKGREPEWQKRKHYVSSHGYRTH